MKDNYGPKLVKVDLFNVERYLAEALMLVAPRNQRQEQYTNNPKVERPLSVISIESVPLFQRNQHPQRERSQIHLPQI